MNLNEFLRTEYKKEAYYSKVVVLAFKKYRYQISVEKISRELDKIIASKPKS